MHKMFQNQVYTYHKSGAVAEWLEFDCGAEDYGFDHSSDLATEKKTLSVHQAVNRRFTDSESLEEDIGPCLS